MFPIPSFSLLHQSIVQEIRNKTGLSISPDSDASIRADGTVAVVEGLYQHQQYIQRQLFIQTADEPYLYIHAEELACPRLGGTRASGIVQASANINMTLVAGSKVTDGKGHYWAVVTDTVLNANTSTAVMVSADQVGTVWNFVGSQLLWVSPQAGLDGTATVTSIAGGSDVEELEDWRARLLQRKQLGNHRDREADLRSTLKEIAGIEHIFVYPKRRGLGSLDVAITATGNPPTLPTQQLLAQAQQLLDSYEAFWGDLRVYAPTQQFVPVSASVTGLGVNLEDVKTVIRQYFAELAPAETYQQAVLSARILSVVNVTDVLLNPSANITPQVDWMHTRWLRLGTLNVGAA